MTKEGDRGEQGLAPVIPLFCGSGRETDDAQDGGAGRHEIPPVPVQRVPAAGSLSDGEDEVWHTTWRDLDRGSADRPSPEFSTVERGGVRFVEPAAAGGSGAADDSAISERAERKLIRSLGTRGLSVTEARARLRQQGVPAEAIDDIVDRLERTGVLDDERLAEQLVHSATVRHSRGRAAIARSLSGRGIARDVVDRAISELPDDDAERALEFARSKARQLARHDDETALRRLVGQLGRRGFSGSLALTAARQAIDESQAPTGRVRFE